MKSWMTKAYLQLSSISRNTSSTEIASVRGSLSSFTYRSNTSWAYVSDTWNLLLIDADDSARFRYASTISISVAFVVLLFCLQTWMNHWCRKGNQDWCNAIDAASGLKQVCSYPEELDDWFSILGSSGMHSETTTRTEVRFRSCFKIDCFCLTFNVDRADRNVGIFKVKQICDTIHIASFV